MVSRRRRRLPAISACFTAFISRSRPTSPRAIGIASAIPIRPAALASMAIPCLIASIFLAPIPFNPSNAPESIALISSSWLVTPRSFQNSAIVFGPNPEISSIGNSPAGTLAASSS